MISFDGCSGNCQQVESICHSIGYANCPTSRTEWRYSADDGWSLSERALIACQACAGPLIGCFSTNGGCGGSGGTGVFFEDATSGVSQVYFSINSAGFRCLQGSVSDDFASTDACPLGFWSPPFNLCEQVEFYTGICGDGLRDRWSSAEACP
ncbi:MAG: hypothetical protein AAF654_10175 [Myxococcota bacterium]